MSSFLLHLLPLPQLEISDDAAATRRLLCTEKSTQNQDTGMILDTLLVDDVVVRRMSSVLYGMLCGCRRDGIGD